MSPNDVNDQEINFLGKGEEEEIDLDSFKNFIARRKNIILTFSGLGFIFGPFVALSSPKVWEGRFQIVLENRQQKPIFNSKNLPITLSNLTQNSSLRTEVEILKSPSVLFDVFNFVKIQKNILYPNKGGRLKYESWLENFEIKLKKSTSVLNISYKDKDKDIILPVLKKVSSTYQDYSGSKGLRNIEVGLSYLDNEIEIYNRKSFSSFIKAQNFAKENNLDVLYENPNSLFKNNDRTRLSYLFDIEQLRIRDASKLENINAKLNLIQTYKKDPLRKINLITKIAKDFKISDFTELKKLENEININLSIYKKNDNTIQRLLNQKEILLRNLENNVVSALASEKELLELKIKVTSRPQEVINKYKQFLSEALRDQKTLENLENEKRLLSLQKSRKATPWQLISEPTLLDQAVSPSRKKILFYEILKFSILGVLVGIILDKKEGLVHNKKKIEQLLDCMLIQELKINNQDNWDQILDLSSDKFMAQDSLSVIKLGNIDNVYFDKFLASLKKTTNLNEFNITNNPVESVKYNTQLIIVERGAVKRKQILEINRFFSLTKSNLIGFFLLD